MFRVIIFSLVIGALASCGGASGSNGAPKDLNFSNVKTADAYADMVLYAITSTRSQFLPNQLSSDNDIDVAQLRVMANSYAQAIKKGDWIREDEEIKEIGDNSIKIFKWLDKRRRVAMKITIDVEKQEDKWKIDQLDFFSNLEVLGKASFQ